MKKIYFMLMSLFVLNSASAENCFPEGCTISYQSQINNFQANYPECTMIEGDLVISGYNISNLNGLNGITEIGGSLIIVSNEILKSLTGLNNLKTIGHDLYVEGNFDLLSLTGLENVNYIGGDIMIMNNIELNRLSGLDGLTDIAGSLSIENNIKLNNLSGLQQVTAIGANLRLFSNNSLTTLSGLEGLTTIGGSLFIGGQGHLGGLGNPYLTTLMALSSLTSIGGRLEIGYNYSLTTLEGIGNISAGTITDLSIYNNLSLTTCEVESICDYLANPSGTVEIFNNAQGCNTPAEVEDACTALSQKDVKTSPIATIIMDWNSNDIIIETPANNDACEFYVVNLKGQILVKGAIQSTRTVLDIGNLPAGVFFLKLTDDRTVQLEKLIRF